MKSFRKISIIILLISMIQIFLLIGNVNAADEMITVKFKDEKFYNGMIGILENGEYESYNEDENFAEPLDIIKSDKDLTIQISADDIKKVKSIELIDRGITNIEGIEQFTELEYITFITDKDSEDANKITDITPLKELTKLEYLQLDNNNVSDIGPVKNLKNLVELDLCYNPISKNIDVIEELENLEVLWLIGTERKTIPNIDKLSKLNTLYLDENCIEDISKIENNTSLKDVTVTNNYIERTIKQNGKQTIKLPQIIKDTKKEESILYDEEDYILKGCVLSQDGESIIVDTDNIETASITVAGGIAKSTKMKIIVEKNIEKPQEPKPSEDKPKDYTVIQQTIPHTGIEGKLIIAIIVGFCISVIAYIKNKKYKNLK